MIIITAVFALHFISETMHKVSSKHNIRSAKLLKKKKHTHKSTPKTTLELEFATSTIDISISLQSGCRASLGCRWSRGERNGYFDMTMTGVLPLNPSLSLKTRVILRPLILENEFHYRAHKTCT